MLESGDERGKLMSGAKLQMEESTSFIPFGRIVDQQVSV